MLLKQEGIAAIEVDVSRLPAETDKLLAEVLNKVKRAHTAGKTSLIYTSRVYGSFRINKADYFSVTRFLPF